MSEAEFRSKRRQKFLTEKYFKLNEAALGFLRQAAINAIEDRKAAGDLDPFGEGGLFKDSLRLFNLHYTAGDSIEALGPLFDEAMRCFDDWHRAYGDYVQSLAQESGEDLRSDGTPLPFDDLFHYQLAIQSVSVANLLGNGDAVRRIASWLERLRGTDMLFEALIEPAVANPRVDIEEFFHAQPYDALLDALFTAETGDEASAFVKKYLDNWYKAFEGVPWHDGHLITTDEYSNYEGYWAFEAAAVCVVHDIDDSTFRDHIVYPKDLADWARAHHATDRIKSSVDASPLRLRCEAGQACPQGGYWFTTAKANSRRRFEAGETMPEIKDAKWGSTVWYWDESLLKSSQTP